MDEEFRSWRRQARSYFEKRVPDPGLVDELVHETCVRAWMTRTRRGCQFALPWLFGIGWRLLADHRRQHYRLDAQRAACPVEALPSFGRESTIAIGVRRYALSRVLRALEQAVEELPDNWAPIVRSRLEGETCAVIGERLGLSENSVKLRLHRCRRNLRTRMMQLLEREED